jgi:phosphotriesterase-related protein
MTRHADTTRKGGIVEDEGMVITVNGPIDPSEVGIALTHEHVFVDLRKYYRPSPDADTAQELDGPVQMNMLGHLRLMDYQNLDNLVLDNYEVATKELARFRKRGGKTICDVSSRGIRIDHLLPSLRRISRSLGLNIVVGTGCYIASYHEPFVGKAEGTDLAALFAKEITLGIGSSGIRAGMIGEIGLGAPPVDVELTVLKAAGWAHLETGAPIIIHQSERKEYSVAHRGLDVLEHEGVRPERVVIAHAGLAEDLNGLEALVRRGAYVAFDHFGMPKYEVELNWQFPQELDYIRRIMSLIDGGHIKRILMAHDVCTKIHLRTYGGTGYDHLLAVTKQMFARAGLSGAAFEQLMRSNPTQVLTIGR